MRGLWWLLSLALLFTALAGAYMIHLVLEARKKPTVGDGKDPATYGFSLEPLDVPAAAIFGSGLPKNGLQVLDLPPRYSAERATSFRGRDKYVVATDIVIGVEAGGRTAAYPLQILNWHEGINDTLGGVPILVHFSPLTATAGAFDRRVGGETLTFGFSGLLCNTHSLVYDRRNDPAAESLWSPLLGRAVAGPAAARGDTLAALSAQLVPWRVWIARHPGTEVLARDEAKIMAYRRSPYGEYYGNDVLRFPTAPLPPDRQARPYKSRMIAVRARSEWVVYDLDRLVERMDPRGIWETTQAEVSLRFTLFPGDPTTAWVEGVPADAAIETRPTMWFAWYAMRPGDSVR